MIRRITPAALLLAALAHGGVAEAQRAPAAQPAPAAAPAAPAAAQPSATQDRGWGVVCAEAAAGAPRECRLVASVMLQPQNQRIAQIVLARQPETRSLGLIFQLPHGALLPAGMTWQVDEGATQRLAFQTSDPQGVYAGLPVADDLLTALRSAGTLRISFFLANRREPVTLPVPLGQFAEATAEFFAAERGTAAPAAAPAPPPTTATPPRR